MSKIFAIIIFFYFLFFVSFPAQAFSPPDGCEADSYIVYEDSAHDVYVDFYKNNVYSCKVKLGSYSDNLILGSSELIYENELFQSLAILFLGIVSAFAFVLGLKTI